MLDVLLDALIDTLKLVPFLFVTYLVMEFIEHKTSMKVLLAIQKSDKFAPLVGGLLGAVPQCGFSAAASGLYAGKIISIGTLLSIYLSTSDEMLPILISEKAPVKLILGVILSKVAIGVFWGYLADLLLFRNDKAHEHINIHGMCKEEHCHCEKGIWGSALKHTVSIAGFILLVSVALGFFMEYVGQGALSNLILNHKIFGPMISALIGLIPNCAASVVITELYLQNAMGIGSLMAGLLSGAGVGWLVLLRASNNVKKTTRVVVALYIFSVITGIVIGLF